MDQLASGRAIVFIVGVIYTRLQPEPDIELYWTLDRDKVCIHTISKIFPYATLNRSNDIAISLNIEQDQNREYHLPGQPI